MRLSVNNLTHSHKSSRTKNEGVYNAVSYDYIVWHHTSNETERNPATLFILFEFVNFLR